MKTFLLLIFIFLLCGCTLTQPEYITRCVSLCFDALNSGANLSLGPCLSNDYYPDYVCDVAHNPRSIIDNDPINQCSAYGLNAYHFVEVDETCKFIKSN